MHAFKLEHPVPDLQPNWQRQPARRDADRRRPAGSGRDDLHGEPQDAFTCGLFRPLRGALP